MTLEVRTYFCADVQQDDASLGVPDAVCAGRKVAAAAFTLAPWVEHQWVGYAHLGALMAEVVRLLAAACAPQQPWLMVRAQVGEQNRITWHDGLWRRLAKDGFHIPPNARKTDEMFVSRGVGGAFYGGFEAGDFDFSSITMQQAHGMYALFPRGECSAADIQALLAPPWSGRLWDDGAFLQAAVSAGCAVLCWVDWSSPSGEEHGVLVFGESGHVKNLLRHVAAPRNGVWKMRLCGQGAKGAQP